jgi:antitoxin HicB
MANVKKKPTAKRRPAAKKVTAKSHAKAKKPNKAIGSGLDDLLKEDGVLNQAQAEAAKRVIAWQVQKMMESQHISKAQLARDLETSRGAVDRILDSENTSMTLKSLGAIADLFDKRLEINLVDV